MDTLLGTVWCWYCSDIIIGSGWANCVRSAVNMGELQCATCLVGIISPSLAEASMALAAPAANADNDYADHYADIKPESYKKLRAGQQNAGGQKKRALTSHIPLYPNHVEFFNRLLLASLWGFCMQPECADVIYYVQFVVQLVASRNGHINVIVICAALFVTSIQPRILLICWSSKCMLMPTLPVVFAPCEAQQELP
jgi:hypothetical protein